jgi:Divergent InlB B-repeat domain
MLTVEISGNANGSVESQPAGIACGASCSASFADGTDIVLTATAASGSTFKAWDGACSGSTTTCTVHLTGDAQVTAHFQPAATQDECAGLAPGDPGEPVRLQATDVGSFCGVVTSDGSGNVAATITDNGPPTIVRLFDRLGVSLGRFGYGFGPLFEQLAGFVGTSCPPGLQLSNCDAFAIDAHGNEIGRDSPGRVLAAAEDPTGGMVAFFLGRGPQGAGATDQGNTLAAYDGSAHLRWRAALANGIRGSGGGITLGVDRLGNTLVLVAEDAVSEIRGQWVDHDGHVGPPFTPMIDLGGDPVNSNFVLAPRAGDGLFLQERSPQRPGWLAQFDSLATAALPPPSWLSSRPLGETVHMARGGGAYAFFSRNSSACAQRIEIVAPSGKSCGTAVFPIAGCTTLTATGGINVGYDGTVIQESPFEERRNDDGTVTCTWQSWPGFLH